MRVTKDGRIKIKFDELRIGMVLKYDDSQGHYAKSIDKEYVLITNIVYVSGSKWFVGLRGISANCFCIPDANRSPDPVHNSYWKCEYMTWANLKQMNLIPQEHLVGEAIQMGGPGEKVIYEKLKKKLKRIVDKIKGAI